MKIVKKRIITALTVFFALGGAAEAQETGTVSDSTAVQVRIFEEMPSNVSIDQPQEVREVFDSQINRHPSESTHSSYVGVESVRGTFQIRIYSDSGQNARNASQEALNRFRTLYPDEPATLTFTAPYFKVTVGHYSSYNDAKEALQALKSIFPKAHIVR